MKLGNRGPLPSPTRNRAAAATSGAPGSSRTGGRDLSLREIARIPGVKLMWSLFITSCAIECTCGNWAGNIPM